MSNHKPVILFACVHNGGRSLAAKVLAEHHAGDRITVRSAGSDPGDSLNPAVVQVLTEHGLSVEGEAPKLLTYESVQEADVVITMGCGETCPVFPGKTYQDWQLDDPKGQDVKTVRRIVDAVEYRVRGLLSELLNQASLPLAMIIRGRSGGRATHAQLPPWSDSHSLTLARSATRGRSGRSWGGSSEAPLGGCEAPFAVVDTRRPRPN